MAPFLDRNECDEVAVHGELEVKMELALSASNGCAWSDLGDAGLANRESILYASLIALVLFAVLTKVLVSGWLEFPAAYASICHGSRTYLLVWVIEAVIPMLIVKEGVCCRLRLAPSHANKRIEFIRRFAPSARLARVASGNSGLGYRPLRPRVGSVLDPRLVFYMPSHRGGCDLQKEFHAYRCR